MNSNPLDDIMRVYSDSPASGAMREALQSPNPVNPDNPTGAVKGVKEPELDLSAYQKQIELPMTASDYVHTYYKRPVVPDSTPDEKDPAIVTARAMLNKPYKWGAKVTDNSGADCSSLVCKASLAKGVHLPRTAYGQFKYFEKRGKLKPLSQTKAGDYLYFNFRNRNKNPIGHTAIVSEVKKGKIKVIEASGSHGKVIERWLPASYYKHIAGVGTV